MSFERPVNADDLNHVEGLVKEPLSKDQAGIVRVQRQRFTILTGLFSVLFGVAVLELSRAVYTAPLGFYVAVGIAAGLLGANAFLHAEVRPGSLLAQVVCLAALVKYYFFSLNPYVYTSDAFYFYLGLSELQTGGYIPSILGHYFYFPGFITYTFAGVTVADVSLEVYGAFAFLSQVTMVPVVYLIGRRVAGIRVGLLSALFAVFWVFGLAWTHYNPSQFGMLFVFVAILSMVRLTQGKGSAWFAVFWIASLAALFSHPINALILALVLVVRYVWFLARKDAQAVRVAAAPFSAYTVFYIGYLAFVAQTAFSLFVQTFANRDYAPPTATSAGTIVAKSAAFIIQSAVAPISMAIPVFFAGVAVLGSARISKVEHGFLVLLGALFLAIPGLEFALENFKFQSTRLLVYLAIPLVFLAAHGLTTAVRRRENSRRALVSIFAVFLVYGFLASSSYLTQNDSRTLYGEIPFTPTHITASALSCRQFLVQAPTGTIVYMDNGMARYMDASSRARDALFGYTVVDLSFFNGSSFEGLVVLNAHFLPYGSSSEGTFYDASGLETALLATQANLLYDSGDIRIYSGQYLPRIM